MNKDQRTYHVRYKLMGHPEIRSDEVAEQRQAADLAGRLQSHWGGLIESSGVYCGDELCSGSSLSGPLTPEQELRARLDSMEKQVRALTRKDAERQDSGESNSSSDRPESTSGESIL